MTNKFAIINLKKMKNKDLAKISEHNRRESPDGHYSNSNIDPERTHLNIRVSDLPEKEQLKTLIDRRIAEREIQNKKVRKDAVKMISVIVTASPEYINSLNREEQIRYFDEAFKFCQNKFNKENVIEMNVHFDETNPHAHIAVVPIINGKLSAKDLVTRKFLFNLQKEFPETMQSKGFNVEKGCGGDPAIRHKHLSEEDYKLKMKEKDQLEKEKNLEQYEKRLEERLSSLEIPSQTLHDAHRDPQLHLEVSEPMFGDKNNVKVNKEQLSGVLQRADLSNRLIAKVGSYQIKINQQEQILNQIRKESDEYKYLAKIRAELLKEKEDQYKKILKENNNIKDLNDQLIIENSQMREYIDHKGLSEDFEDWSAALKEVKEELIAELNIY